jgi:exodeoxyribonuclease V alpha subunit
MEAPIIELDSYKIQIETVTFQNPSNGWTVLKVRECEKDMVFSAVGNFATVHPGELFMLFGKWTVHSSFGRQFSVSRAVSLKPTEADDLIRYLSSGLFKGIGPKIAEKIVGHFGEKTLHILNEKPQKLKTVPKLSKKIANKLIQAWGEKTINSEAMQFLSHHGITLKAAEKIIAAYGSDTISVISQNPYRLIRHIKGFGFMRADEIARAMGIAQDSPQRIEHAIVYLLNMAEDYGHCFQTASQIYQNLNNQLSINDEEKIRDAFESLQDQGLMVSQSLSDESEDALCYFLPDLFEAEERCAEEIIRILKAPFHNMDPTTEEFRQRVSDWLEKFSGLTSRRLSSEQKDAVFGSVSSKVFILTGGPGVGKTTTANAIIHLLKAMGKKVVLGAPTGRAAQRMKEVSSLPAKTIHRLLEWSSEGSAFLRCEDNRLDAHVVIIDESSMLDVRLAQSLLLAVPDHAQLIFIGDKDQLPPVGPGNFFRDLIESQQVPLKQLDRIFRQAKTSQIISVAHDLNRGYVPEFNNEDSDCHFIDAENDEEVLEKIKNIMSVNLPEAGYDTMQEVQILSPMNKGILGCQNLNTLLQDLLNPSSNTVLKKNKTWGLRIGDKVIQTVNNYELHVYNGDIGFVKGFSDEKEVFVRFGDRFVKYSFEQSGDLKLAYSITIHKSQGSEFPVVVIPMSMGHYVMLQRNLVYTGLTRAKKLAIFLGSRKALALAARNRQSQTRQTCLQAYMRKSLGSPYLTQTFFDGFEESIGA